MPIDKTLLPDYFTGKRKHIFYEDAKARALAFAPHADGTYPKDLIDERRPNEPLEVKLYREKVWKPKTKPTFGRVLSSLGKIRRSADWSVTYPATEFSRIREGERLQDYCEEDFPYYESVTNWVFGELLKMQLTDPNAICIIMPLNQAVEVVDFLKPYPFLYSSSEVIEYAENDFVLLNNPAGAVYYSDRGRVVNIGKSFYYADALVIEKWDQVNAKGDIKQIWSYAHGLNRVPFFKLFGLTVKTSETARLNASRIEDILPELDEAVREYSDLQGGKVGHMHPERWEYTQAECTVCKGIGNIRNTAWTHDCNCPETLPCTNPNCHSGYVSASGPYKTTVIRPTNTATEGGTNAPMPPIGYVTKDIAILQFMDQSIANHMYAALAAINFQFLEQAPLNQSGLAKEVDKDELNNTVHGIAEDLVRAMDKVYLLIAIYRYKTQYPNDADKMVPTIPVPEHFDILSVNYLGEELDKAKKAGLNPAILNELEIEYASKKFNADHDVADFLALILKLDPLSNVTQDDKLLMLTAKGITQKSYVISSNIQPFVQRAIEEDADFGLAPLPEQVQKMNQYAEELIKSMETTAVIVPDVAAEETDPNAPLDEEDLEIIEPIAA